MKKTTYGTAAVAAFALMTCSAMTVPTVNASEVITPTQTSTATTENSINSVTVKDGNLIVNYNLYTDASNTTPFLFAIGSDGSLNYSTTQLTRGTNQTYTIEGVDMDASYEVTLYVDGVAASVVTSSMENTTAEATLEVPTYTDNGTSIDMTVDYDYTQYGGNVANTSIVVSDADSNPLYAQKIVGQGSHTATFTGLDYSTEYNVSIVESGEGIIATEKITTPAHSNELATGDIKTATLSDNSLTINYDYNQNSDQGGFFLIQGGGRIQTVSATPGTNQTAVLQNTNPNSKYEITFYSGAGDILDTATATK